MSKLKKISLEKARKLGLKEVGKAFSENMEHAFYLMSKNCKDADKVKYYTIEISVLNDDTHRGEQVIRFWRGEE